MDRGRERNSEIEVDEHDPARLRFDSAQQENLRIYDENWESWLGMKKFGPSSRWLRMLIKDALHRVSEAPSSVVDVGCGEGTNTAALAKTFSQANVLGLDQSHEAVRLACQHHGQSNLRFRHGSLDALGDQQFAMVSCLEVLEHVDDWQQFLTRLCTLAERYLLLSFPTGRMRPFERHVGHVRNFAPGEVEHWLGRHGFKAASIAYAGFPFYSPIYRNLCQLTNAGANNFTRGTYGWKQKLVAQIIFGAFRHFSTQSKWGDQFVGLFCRSDSPPRASYRQT